MIAAASASAHRPIAEAYRHQPVALLTQHGKEQVISPILLAAIGCRVERVEGYDTDLLGTFTRDIPRAGTQVEAARKKARLGMQMSGRVLGVASEGSFGGDPMLGMLPWNREMLIWIDDVNALEIVGLAQGPAQFGHRLATDWTEAEAFARQWGFPAHHIVVRPETGADPRIKKGIASWPALNKAFARAKDQASNGLVFLETDVRAFANPTRLQMIGHAAADLAAQLRSPCPACGAPGFWTIERVHGLPCQACGAPTETPKADVLGCVSCPCREIRACVSAETADPSRCDYCNP